LCSQGIENGNGCAEHGRGAFKFDLRHTVAAASLPFTEVTAESLKKVIPEKNSMILKEYELSACDPNQVLSSHM
jgi:hypothetical protein